MNEASAFGDPPPFACLVCCLRKLYRERRSHSSIDVFIASGFPAPAFSNVPSLGFLLSYSLSTGSALVFDFPTRLQQCNRMPSSSRRLCNT